MKRSEPYVNLSNQTCCCDCEDPTAVIHGHQQHNQEDPYELKHQFEVKEKFLQRQRQG
ncbi:hypothetical protein L195_g050921, partial [Trifolium pratense]